MLKIAKKFILAFPEEKRGVVLELIERSGGFEVVENKDSEISKEKEKTLKAIQEIDYLISSFGFAIDYLKPFAEKATFLKKIKNQKIIVKNWALENFQEKSRLVSLVERVVEIEKEIEILNREQRENENKLIELENFGNLEFAPRDTDLTFSFLVAVPLAQVEKFEDFCFKNKIHRRELQRRANKIFSLVVGLKEEKNEIKENGSGKERFLQGLKSFRGEVVLFNFSHSPLEEKGLISEKVKENKKKIEGLKKELLEQAQFLGDLKIYYDFLNIKKARLEIKKRCLEGGFLNYLLFWALEKKKDELEKKLRGISPEIIIIETAPEKDESPPVILENHKIIRPFQYVTEIFGLPRVDEIDPTPYFALFFIVYFGICLTDAAYGFLMALLTGLALLFLKELFSDNKLIKLLFYGGIFTLVIGVLFGSYFGATPADLKMPFLGKLKLIDPIENTVIFMIFAFLLGYFQVFFAQIVRIIAGARNKKREMVLAGIAWGAFYVAGAVYILSLRVPALRQIGFWALLIFGLGVLAAESRGVKIFLKPLVGAVKFLQGLIGTMSDILSYSRLMALGLATSVIALIINQIAGLFGGMIPYIGWLVAGIILICGHILNLGINALGAFIHSGRLQFVEFFPKFLEGGGKRFNPTQAKLKYIKVE